MDIQLNPTIKQGVAWIKLLDKKTRFVVFGGGGGGGKSWLGCEWLLSMCLQYPKTKWFIGREELKRLLGSTYMTFLKVCSHHNIPKEKWRLNGQYGYIEFDNGSRIDLLDLKNLPSDPLYERFGSLEYTGGWIEEAGEINFKAFDTLKSRIGRQLNKEYNIKSKIFITCNPKKNWLYTVFYIKWKNKTLPDDSYFIQSLYNDNPYTAEEYEFNLKSISDEGLKQRLMYGNWEYTSDPSKLMEYDAIIDLWNNSHIKETEKRYLSVDVARFGRDRTVICVWYGLVLKEMLSYDKTSVQEVVNLIVNISEKHKVPRRNVVIDEDGVGGGVLDFLPNATGFVNNSKCFPEKGDKMNYANLKTQCYFKLAEYVTNSKIYIEDKNDQFKEYLVQELEQVKRKDIDKDSTVRIVDKEAIKENIGRSPDFSDAVMLRMFFEVSNSNLTVLDSKGIL